MATIPSSTAIPSEKPVDLKFNAGKIDEIVNSPDDAYQDRFGNARLTWAGIENITRESLLNFGYVTVDSFEDGATITAPNQVLHLESNGEYYRWNGAFPKVVPAGSTPESSGGISSGAWVSVGDASLRSDLASTAGDGGASLVSYKAPYDGAVALTLAQRNAKAISAADFYPKGDGISDDTDALQKAISAAVIVGKSLFIPAGRYRTTRRLTVDGSCIIFGEGWQDVRDYTGPTTRNWNSQFSRGTIIYQDYLASADQYGFYITGNTVMIRDIEVEQNQGDPSSSTWTASVGPTAFYAYAQPYYEHGGQTLMLDNIMLRNPYRGIFLENVARGYITRIYGQPLDVGISVNRSGDVVRISDIHFGWPFWSSSSRVMDYQIQNTVALLLGRIDNPTVDNIFTFGIKVGVHTYTETSGYITGGPSRLHMSNLGFDDCVYGLLLENAGEVSVSNMYAYCRTGSPTISCGIYSTNSLGAGYITTLMANNVDIMGSDGNAIYLANYGNAMFSNLRIRSWNTSGSTFSAIRADRSKVIINGINLDNSVSNGGLVYEANGTATITGYTGEEGNAVYNAVTFVGTCNASGNAVVSHSITSLISKGMMAQCYYRASADGAMTPMALSFINSSNMTFTGGVSGQPYRATLLYSPKVISAW